MYEHKYKKIDFVSAFENLLVCRMEGPFWEKIERKSRNSRRARGGEVGAKGMVTKGAILRSPGTKYQRSKNVFASTPIALTLVPLGTKLLEISAQFLIWHSESRYPLRDWYLLKMGPALVKKDVHKTCTINRFCMQTSAEQEVSVMQKDNMPSAGPSAPAPPDQKPVTVSNGELGSTMPEESPALVPEAQVQILGNHALL